jgi:transcriptional regulator with XRE-family HTH domain
MNTEDVVRRGLRQILLDDFAQELRSAIRASERRRGQSVDRTALAREISVSRNSVYSYLNGRRLPSATVLQALMTALGLEAAIRRRLISKRDAVADHRHLAEPPSIPTDPTSKPEPTPPSRPTKPTTSVTEPEQPADAAPPSTHSPGPTPNSMASNWTAPRSVVPRSTAPDSTAPHSTAPHSTAPHSTAPNSAASGLPVADSGSKTVDDGGSRRGRRRRMTSAIGAGVAILVVAGVGWSLHAAHRPAVTAGRGGQAVGHTGPAGATCTDTSCAYVTVALEHFVPGQAYDVICHANGGANPIENRRGYHLAEISTDRRGHASMDRACIWGYRGTEVWVSVETLDGRPLATSAPVDWGVS